MLIPSIYWTTPAGRQHAGNIRPGAVLLIVLVVLTIFATLGLAFIFYAESAAISAAAFRDSPAFRGPDMEPELAFAMFLQQLIFDCRDDGSGYSSALRGHSLIRNMYGLKYTINANGTVSLDQNNNVPFNGIGRLHFKYGSPGVPGNVVLNGPKVVPADDFDLISYVYFPQDGFLRDPERFGLRTPASPGVDNRGAYIGGLNAPYTAADMNCLPLAAVKADGTVLLPSFHRNYNGISLDYSDSTYKYWSQDDPTRPWLKYTVLRPRYADHPSNLKVPDLANPGQFITIQKPGFPLPDDQYGDVQNRPPTWGGTGNDSIWMDIGAPVFTLPDGRQYKCLFAPLIVDLDGKINLNAHGNIREQNFSHASNMGLGERTEINVGQVLTATVPNTNKPEWTNLFLGALVPGTNPPKLRLGGKFGANTGPAAAKAAPLPPPFLNPPHFYAKVDFDAVSGWTLALGGTPTNKWNGPGPYQCWPTYPPGYDNASPSELAQHQLLFNTTTAAAGYRLFGAGELNKIYRYGDTNSDAMLSDLWQLLPNNFNAIVKGLPDPNNVRRRNMVTTLSNDRREPGMSPWLWISPSGNHYQLTGFPPPPKVPPQLPVLPQALPTPVRPGALPLSSPNPALFANAKQRNIGKEYGPTDWRSQAPVAQRISLNPTITDNATFVKNPIAFKGSPTLINYPLPAANTHQITDLPGFLNAENSRASTRQWEQQYGMPQYYGYANRIFQLLVKVTGAYDIYGYSKTAQPPPQPPVQGDRDALRYLAQLAVNIVDFIDTDDYITPFNWGAEGSAQFQADWGSSTNATGYPSSPWNSEWVYGTELPKVVINEAYCEYINDPQDPGLKPGAPQPHKATYYYVDTWAELCNPFLSDSTLTDNGDALIWAGQPGYPVYRLLVTNQNMNLHAPSNSDGRPDNLPPGPLPAHFPLNPKGLLTPGNVWGHVDAEFGANPITQRITALNGGFAAPTNPNLPNNAKPVNAGFYLVGPEEHAGGKGNPKQIQPVELPTFPPRNLPQPQNTPQAPNNTVSGKGMRYKFDLVPFLNPQSKPPSPPTLLLQRLLCPHLPPNPDPAQATPAKPYNPYITVDYFDMTGPNVNNPNQYVNNAASHDHSGQIKNNPLLKGINQRKSVGRKQPYRASTTNLSDPNPVPQAASAANQPQHTFFYQNTFYNNGNPVPVNFQNWGPTGPPPPKGYPAFDWLVHLDRNPTSPMELLHVSGYRPHELTQEFTGQMFGHQAPWFDNNLRLYRFFEFLETPSRQVGSNLPTNMRIPGKININTIWDLEVFQALCDPNLSSHFNSGQNDDVQDIFYQLLRSRNPKSNPPIDLQVSAYDQPFLPLSAGVVPVGDPQYPNQAPNLYHPYGLGIGNTLLRPYIPTRNDDPNQVDPTKPASKRLFEPFKPYVPKPPPTPNLNPNPNHPYVRLELLNKIYNNVTTRSNCFAAWVTVGFFEVNYVDSATGRAYLGQEMGRAEGRNIRHRMFAVVDRSVMDKAAQPPTYGRPYLPNPLTILNPKQAPPPTLNLAEDVLNQTTLFNPQSAVFKNVVPFFTVIE